MGEMVGDQKMDSEGPWREAIENQEEEEMPGYGIAEQLGLSLDPARTMQYIGGRLVVVFNRFMKKQTKRSSVYA